MIGRKRTILVFMMVILMIAVALNGCKTTVTEPESEESQTVETTTAEPEAETDSEEPEQLYEENVELTVVHGNIHFGGEDFVEDDTIVAYVEDLFNCDLELIRASDWTTTINTMAASGELPDIMHQADNPLNNQLYNDLVAADALADFMTVAEANPGAYPNLLEITQEEWAQKLFSEDGGETYYVLPREYGLYPHAFFIRSDWLDELNLEMPTTLDEFYSVLEAIVAADPDGMETTGLVVPGQWALGHILAGYNGAGNYERWVVEDGKYISSAIAETTREGLRFLNKMYENGLLDEETFTTSQDIAIGKFVNGEAAAIIIDFTYATNIETSLLEMYSDAELDVVSPDLEGPNNIARYAGTQWYQGIAVSASSVDVERCYSILEWILSDDGQDILTNGIEGTHYTLSDDGTVFKNLDLFEHEMWGLEGYQTKHRFRALIELTQTYNPEYYVNQDLVSNFFDVLNTLGSEVGMDAMLGNTLDSENDVGSLPDDTASAWYAEFIMGTKSLDDDWDAYVAEYYKTGYQTLEDEANSKYTP
jgi:ABC-type glycerol-3-phosphate transport system substrate-binding protein